MGERRSLPVQASFIRVLINATIRVKVRIATDKYGNTVNKIPIHSCYKTRCDREKREQISMPKKKEKKIDLTKLKPDELMKYEIAAELGLFDKVMQDGWQSLTSRETGKIGGMVTQRKKAQKEKGSLTQ